MAPKNGTHYTATDPPPKVVLKDFGASRTRQSELAGTDVNNILAKYLTSGTLPVEGRQAFFADVSEMPDYRTALQQIQMADRAFNALSAKVRARFDNDPAQMLDFVSNPDNRDEMIELGLIEKPGEAPPGESSPDPPVEEAAPAVAS